jgi:hypothetical protein
MRSFGCGNALAGTMLFTSILPKIPPPLPHKDHDSDDENQVPRCVIHRWQRVADH